MAASLDFRVAASIPWYTFTVATGADYSIILPSGMISLKHLGYQDDAFATPSGANDAVVVMEQGTSMAANMAAGKKLIILPGESWMFDSNFIVAGDDGPHEVHMRAVGNQARMMIVHGAHKLRLSS